MILFLAVSGLDGHGVGSSVDLEPHHAIEDHVPSKHCHHSHTIEVVDASAPRLSHVNETPVTQIIK